MQIFLKMTSKDPLYIQIKEEIKKKIITKELSAESQLPSVRVLSKELKVGVVTIKRAYDELVNEGFIISKEAIGYFVLEISDDWIKKIGKEIIKEDILNVKEKAKMYKLSNSDIELLLKEELENE
ncbi:MAG: GntR family transcriptional regulator [Acholeplasma sp.]|nr:GntR family transcriptional regulator [Acholeplasma sp.]